MRSERRRTRSGSSQFNGIQRFTDDFQTIEYGRSHDNSRTMLVIVEHRNLHPLAALALDNEALRRLDIFQIDAAECRCKRSNDLDQLGWLLFVHFNIEHIDAREF